MTKTEIALLRGATCPCLPPSWAGYWALLGWLRACGTPHWYWVFISHRHRGRDNAVHPATNGCAWALHPRSPLPGSANCARPTQLSAGMARNGRTGSAAVNPACLRSRQFVAMPSQAVDVLARVHPARSLPTVVPTRWVAFCTTPRPKPPQGMHNDGLRRAWFWACREESIDPKAQPPAAAVCTGCQVRHPQQVPLRPDCRLTGAQSSSAANASSGIAVAAPPLRHRFSDGSQRQLSGGFGGADCSDGSGGDGGGDGGGGQGGD